jgi:hypothetical protein
LFDAQGLHLTDEVLPEDSIPIAQQILWRAVPQSFPQLLDCGSRKFGIASF